MITVEYPKHPVRTADVTALCVSASASPLSAWWSPKNTLFRSSFSPSKIQTEHKKKSQMISIFSLLAYAENSSKKKSNAKAFPTKSLSSLSICWYLWDFTRNFSLFRNQLSIWWPLLQSSQSLANRIQSTLKLHSGVFHHLRVVFL